MKGKLEMKKGRIALLILSIFLLALSGCGKEKEQEEIPKVMIYNKLEITNEPIVEDKCFAIEDGINKWTKAFLSVDSDSKDKKETDKVLYDSIKNEEQSKKLKKERTKFYKDSDVKIEEVQTNIISSQKAKYSEREVGVVQCEVLVKGIRNEENFEQTYTMKLVVDYIGEIVSVYEIDDITWK